MRMTIARKLWIGFGILVLIPLAVAIIAYLGIKKSDADLQRLAEIKGLTVEAINQMEINAIGIEAGVLEYLRSGDPRYREQVEDYESNFKKAQDRYSRLVERRQQDQIGRLYERYIVLGETLMDRRDDQEKLLSELDENFESTEAILDEGIRANTNENESKKAKAATDLEVDLATTSTRIGTYLRVPQEEHKERVLDSANELDKDLEKFGRFDLTKKEQDQVDELGKSLDRRTSLIEDVIDLDDANREDLKEFLRLRTDIDGALNEASQTPTGQGLSTAEAAAGQEAERTIKIIFIVLAAGLLVGGVTAATIGGGIVRSVRRLVEGVDKVGDGVLDHRIEVATKDEIGHLARAFNCTATKIQNTEEIRRLNQSLKNQVEGQSAQLEAAIVDLRDRERMLRESEERYNLIVEGSNNGTFDWDLRKDEIHWNDHFLEIVGLSHQESPSSYEAFLKLIHPDDRRRLQDVTTAHLEHDAEYSVEYRIRHADGGYRHCVSHGKAQRDQNGAPVRMAGVINDVTERKILEEQLAHLAFYDSLTDLPNRALFMDRLQHALDRAKRQEENIAVLFLDLDNFKIVNDSLGHEVGDLLLVSVAERLRACLRPGDTVARFGGDEFTILLEHTSMSEANRVAERIARELKAQFSIGDREVFATTSIGIALNDSAQDQPVDLLRDADSAMYEAKHAGKARHEMYQPSMSARALERLDLENDLRRAVDKEEFVVYYQPKVSLETVRVFGFEALVRWKHPKRGLVPPLEFITLSEETGLIFPIGQWVLKEACRQAREWQDRYPDNPPLMMSVNLSPKQFHRPDLVDGVAQALAQTGLDPRSLTLEITEDVLVKDAQLAGAVLGLLKNLRIRIAIDDFGTGYSSLSRLKYLPVDTLKIDRSFVSGLGENSEDKVLVSGMMDLASGLGLDVIAEGVETSRQLAQLRSLGCEMAQGFYFSKPLPSEEISSLLATNYGS